MRQTGLDDFQNNIEERASEVRSLIARNDVGRALDRLLDFAKDFGSRQNLRSAVIQSNSYREVAQRIRDYGPTPLDTPERNRILGAVLELIDQVQEQYQPAVSEETRSPHNDHTPARNAFTAGTQNEQPDRKEGLILRVRELRRIRRTTPPPFELKNVSLDLLVGEILAVVGANGQGKSTLLEIISGRLACHDGELLYPFVEQDWSLIKRHIAYMPQSAIKTVGISEIELRYIAGLYGSLGSDNDLVVDYTLARLGLTNFRTVPAGQLSRGYQVRFGLALALLKRPKLLVLDEPLAHLDLPTQARFLGDLRDLSRSPTNPFAVVISSQHLHEIESISDKTLVLYEGHPQFYGNTVQIGAHRSNEMFEILSDKSNTEILSILSPLGTCIVERAGANALIYLPLGITSEVILKQLLEHGVVISYFRNIGNSARSMLGEEL
jgi:ABC-2 type transport system ATP-binding protein